MSTTPYLGSKISLVSKAKIRYEGILYTIDTQESTVALAKVRSLGTEDRPTDRPVAARNEVFEYIIFRGSDIEDLHVCEPYSAQKQQPSNEMQDPAIVKTSASAVFPVTQQVTTMPTMPVMPTMPISSSTTIGSSSASNQTITLPASTQAVEKPTHTQKRSSPTQDSGVQVDSSSQEKHSHQQQPQNQRMNAHKETNSSRRQNQESSTQQTSTEFNMNRLSYNNQPLQQRSNYNNEYNNQHYNQNNEYNNQQPRNRMLGSTSSYGNHANNLSYNQRRNNGQTNAVGSQRSNQQHVSQQRDHRNQYNNSPRPDRTNNVETRRQQRQSNSGATTIVEPLKFNDEFNFEEANARFEQEIEKDFADKCKIGTGKNDTDLLTTSQSAEHLQQLQQDQAHIMMKQKVLDSDIVKHHHHESEENKTCYDKNSSFFDRISCESSDKNQTKPKNWKEERKTNVETFGMILRQHNGSRNNYRSGNQNGYNYNYLRRNVNGSSNQQSQYRNNNMQQRYYNQQQPRISGNQSRGNNGYNNSNNGFPQTYRSRTTMEVGGGNDGFQQRISNSGHRRYNNSSR